MEISGRDFDPQNRYCLSVENTHPLSLIHIRGKLFEKLVISIVSFYLYEHKIISSGQFGFLKNLSTSDCVIKLYPDITIWTNNNLISCCILLDYGKAFDSVNQAIILHNYHYQ